MPAYNTDIEKAIANDFNRIRLECNGTTVNAFLMEGTTFSFGSRYETPFESIGAFGIDQDAINNANMAVTSALNAIQGQANQISQQRLQSLHQTVAIWTGADRVTFNLSMMFIALTPSHDVRVDINKLIGFTTPRINSEVTMEAPMGYAGNGRSATNAISVDLGQWFSTPPIFVMRGFTPSISQIPTKSGLPLYAQISVSLEAYRLFGADEVQEWFGG